LQKAISVDSKLQKNVRSDRVWDGADSMTCEPLYKPKPKWAPVDGDTKGTIQREFCQGA